MKIALIAFDDFTDLDLILHWDILNRVRTIGGKVDWSVRILGTKEFHTSSLGLPIPMSGGIEEASEADAVLFSSGRGTRQLLLDNEYLARLKLDPKRQILAAQCSGSLILGALGLLKGKKVSAYAPILAELKKYEAELVPQSLVVQEGLATASSCLAGQFLSKWLIESLVNEKMADLVMDTVRPIGDLVQK